MERNFFIVLLLSHNSQYNIGDWCLQTVAPVSVNHGLKLITGYCILLGQRIYQNASLNRLCQYLPSLNIFFNSSCHYLSFLKFFSNRFCRVEKSGVTPHCLYRDSLTLSHASKANLKLIIPLLIQRESVIQIIVLLSRIYHGL